MPPGLDEGKRGLWIYLMPGLTAEILRRAAIDAGVAKVVEVPDGDETRTLELWPKLGETTGAQWAAIRERCEQMLGLEPGWQDRQFAQLVARRAARGGEAPQQSIDIERPARPQHRRPVKEALERKRSSGRW